MSHNQRLKGKEEPIHTIYSPEVLVGNWFQERISGLQNDVHAITPGIYGQSRCLEVGTTYRSDYLQPVRKEDPRGTDDFIDVKVKFFRNRMRNQETNIQQSNDLFLSNMTTMTDLQYRILPKAVQGISKEGDWMLKKSSKDDISRSYGNQTNFGLLQAKKCEELQELCRYRHQSEMKSNFGRQILSSQKQCN